MTSVALPGALFDLAFHTFARLSFTARIASLTRDVREPAGCSGLFGLSRLFG
jgi:hypothetical protein